MNTLSETKKISIAKNTSTLPTILYKMMSDENDYVVKEVVSNPNINTKIFKKLITSKRIYSTFVYHKFSRNSSFKKEWIYMFIDFLKDKPRNVGTILTFLETQRFFENDEEWITLYDYIYKIIGTTEDNSIIDFWHFFFKFPEKNYSEKIVLKVLNDYGEKLATVESALSSIANTPMETGAVKAKLYELTQNEEFLPQEALDIFLF